MKRNGHDGDRAISKAVKAMLGSLGPKPDRVASRLEEDGVRGTRGDCGACPLARKVRDFLCSHEDVDATSGKIQVMVGDDTTEALWVDGQQRGHMLVVENPPACADFVHKFDSGDYPTLDEEASWPSRPPTA